MIPSSSIPRWKALAREGAWVIAGQGLAAVGSVMVIGMLAHWMTPDEFGLFSLGITASAIGQMILFGPWGGSALRFDALATSEGRARGFLTTVLTTQLQLSAVGGVLTIIAIGMLWCTHHRQVLILSGAAAVTVIAAAWAYLASALQSARRQRSVIAIHQGVTPWLRLMVVFGAMQVLGRNATATMIGWAVATVLVAISQWRFIPCRRLPADPPGQTSYRSRMIAYAVPFMLWGVFACAQAAMDRWSLRWATDLATVGIYSVAFQLGFAPALLLGSFVEQMVAPVAFKGAGDAMDDARLTMANWRVLRAGGILVLAALLGSAAAWFGAAFIRSLLPPSYVSAAGLVAPMFLAGGLYAAAQVLIIAPLSRFDSHRIILPRVLTSTLAVLAYLGGAYAKGLRGVVIAQVIVSIIFLVWITIIVRTRLPRLKSAAQ